MKTKNCPICKIDRPLDMFSKNKARKDGLNYHCKSCEKNKMKKWLENNRDHCKEKSALWYEENKDRATKYRIENKEKIAKRMAEWRKSKKEHIKQYKTKYNKEVQSKDINYRLVHNLRTRLQQSIKGNKKWARTMELVGCDVPTLKAYLESKFTQGMSWENYGRKGWHIDHIIPCDAFDMTIKENQIKCFHYTNLQPLWWIDNCRKSNTIL
jgi:hypothetical protein